jgi:preprotein translocase subunit YajC
LSPPDFSSSCSCRRAAAARRCRLTRSGLYGTLVEFDSEDLTMPALIEIAPGVEVEVHAQTVTLDQNSYHVTEDEETEEIEENDAEISDSDDVAFEEKTDDDDVEVTITDEDVYDGLLDRDKKSDDNKSN